MEARVIGLEKLGKHDVELVGGKNSSLGEMISHLSNAGVSVPGGFATTAQAYREFLEQSGLNAKINAELTALNVDDVNALAETGAKIRQWIVDTPLTAELEQEIRKAFAAAFKRQPRHRGCRSFICDSRRLTRCFICRPTRNFLKHSRYRQRT